MARRPWCIPSRGSRPRIIRTVDDMGGTCSDILDFSGGYFPPGFEFDDACEFPVMDHDEICIPDRLDRQLGSLSPDFRMRITRPRNRRVVWNLEGSIEWEFQCWLRRQWLSEGPHLVLNEVPIPGWHVDGLGLVVIRRCIPIRLSVHLNLPVSQLV